MCPAEGSAWAPALAMEPAGEVVAHQPHAPVPLPRGCVREAEVVGIGGLLLEVWPTEARTSECRRWQVGS